MNLNSPKPPPKPSPFDGLPFAGPWPAVLPRSNGDPVLPLATGISDDLLLRLPEQHWPALKKALRQYCSSRAYFHALTTDGATRHGPDGQGVAPVSEIDQLVAAIRLLEIALRFVPPERAAQAAPVIGKAKAIASTAAAPASALSLAAEPPQVSQPPVHAGESGRPILSLERA